MKQKSKSRKGKKNDFRFISFSEKLANTSIDSIYRINRNNPNSADFEFSFIINALEEHALNNASTEFSNFIEDIEEYVGSYQQVVYHQLVISDVLKTHLASSTVLSASTLMDCLVNFAKDIQGDFYQYFPDFFKILCEKFSILDFSLLTAIFETFANIFKLLVRPLSSKITELFQMYSILFSHKRALLRRFAAESFAFVARRVADIDAFITMLFSQADDNRNFQSGISIILFEIVKGTSTAFHSKFKKIVTAIFQFSQQSATSPLMKSILIRFTELLAQRCVTYKSNDLLMLLLDLILEQPHQEVFKMCIEFLINYKQGRLIRLNDSKVLYSVINLWDRKCDLDTWMTFAQRICLNIGECKALAWQKFVDIIFSERISFNSIYELMISVFSQSKDSVNIIFILESVEFAFRNLIDHFDEVLFFISWIFENESTLAAVNIAHISTDLHRFVEVDFKKSVHTVYFILKIYYVLGYDVYDDISYFIEMSNDFISDEFEETCLTLSNIINFSFPIEFDILNFFINNCQQVLALDLFAKYAANYSDRLPKHCPLQLLKALQSNITSCSKAIRVHSLYTLSVFDFQAEGHSNIEDIPIFEIMNQAELICNDDYRERLRLLEQLRAEKVFSIHQPTNILLKQTVLKYLFVQLLDGFQPVFKPLCEILETYANHYYELFDDVFWTFFCDSSQSVNIISRLPKCDWSDVRDINDLFHYIIRKSSSEEIDFKSEIKLKLLKMLSVFPDLSQRMLIRLGSEFHQFIGQSYSELFHYKFPSQDLTLDFNELTNESNLIEDDVENDDDVCLNDNEEFMDAENCSVTKQAKNSKSYLISFLNLFNEMDSLCPINDHFNFNDILQRLLCMADSEIQTGSIKCLIKMKNNHLEAHSELLVSLCTEKKFQNTMVSLSQLLKDDNQVKVINGDLFFRTVLNILHGKLFNKNWRKSIVQRSRIIFQHVSMFDAVHQEFFIQNIFLHYMNLSTDLTSLNIRSISPPLSFQNKFLVLFKQSLKTFKFSVVGYLKPLINITIYFGICSQKISDEGGIGLNYYNSLKFIKRLFIIVITDIFELQPDFQWADEISKFCGNFLQTELSKLTLKVTKNVTGVLKLFTAWCKQPRHHQLLCYKTEFDKPVISLIVELLLNPKVSLVVVKYVLNMLWNLISSDTSDENLTFGQQLLFSEHSNMICFFSKYLNTKLGKDCLAATPDFFKILAFFSKHITDKAEISTLINLIIGLITDCKKQSSFNELLLNLVESVHILSRSAKISEGMLFKLSTLFSYLSSNDIRSSLCKVFGCYDQQLSDILLDLNAWNKQVMDEPDFERRFAAFNVLNDYLSNQSGLSLCISGSCIAHCSVYFLNTVSDFALKKEACITIQNIIKLLAQNLSHPFCTTALHDMKLVIFQGIRNFEENNRSEIISILRCFIIHCSSMNEWCKQLTPYINDDKDSDLFENLAHIQQHRRVRAFNRIKSVVANEKFCDEILLKLFLPLSMTILSNSDLVKLQSDYAISAIDLLSTIAESVEYNEYIKIFRFSLNLVAKFPERHRIYLQLIDKVLDAFHFTLRNEKGNPFHHLRFNIMPKLLRLLSASKSSQGTDKTQSEIEITNLPIALSAIKIMRYYPEDSMAVAIRGLLIKTCGFLRSKDFAVRKATREVLLKMLPILNSGNKMIIFEILTSTLDKGYMLHVLSFTVNRLLGACVEDLKVGDLNAQFKNILNLLMNDLIGEKAEQQEVRAIVQKTKEAKTFLAHSTFGYIASISSMGQLMQILGRLRTALEEKPTLEFENKINQCLSKIALGILKNDTLSLEELLNFVTDIFSNSVDCLLPAKNSKEVHDARLRKTDYCLLVEPPKRNADVVTATAKYSNVHVFVEFALSILCSMFKKLTVKVSLDFQCIEDIIAAIFKLSKSQYLRTVNLCCRCFTELLKLRNENLLQKLPKLFELLCSLLQTFCRGITSNRSDIQELIPAIFHCITLVIKEERFHCDEEKMKFILLVVEEDLFDSMKNKFALSLLGGVFECKLQIEEIHPILQKVAKMCVQSEIKSIRSDCRLLYITYLSKFPLRRVDKSLQFFISQLSYDDPFGRQSALEVISQICSSSPAKFVNNISAQFFIPISMVLINDDVPKCREMAGIALKILISVLNKKQFEAHFNDSLTWLSNSARMSVNKLGAMVLKIFIAEQSFQETVFAKCMNHICNCFKRAFQLFSKQEDSDIDELKDADHTVFVLLEILIRMLDDLSKHLKLSYVDEFSQCFGYAFASLNSEHIWVQKCACDVFAKLFSVTEIDDIIRKNRNVLPYLFQDYPVKLFELAKSFCSLIPVSDSALDSFLNTCMENITYLSRVFVHSDFQSRENPLELIVNRLSGIALKESAAQLGVYSKRTVIFKWIAVIFSENAGRLEPYWARLIQLLVRDLVLIQKHSSVDKSRTEFESLIGVVLDEIKKRIGDSQFFSIYTSASNNLRDRRIERKRKLAADFLLNPEAAAKRKQQKNKLSAKRRKKVMVVKSFKRIKVS